VETLRLPFDNGSMKNSPTGSEQAAQCDIGVRGALLLLINTYSILYEVILSGVEGLNDHSLTISS